MSKSPAFQFYVKDWLASTKVRLMNHAERGAYMDLMCHTWNEEDCSLNNDDEELAILSGLNEKWLGRTAEKIKACFILKGSRLVHERLLAEREKQKMFSEKCKKAGMASGKARRDKALELNERSPHVEHKMNSSVCSLQSSSASSSTSTKKNKDYPPSFEEWWNIYPKRNGKRVGKADTFVKWEKVKESDYEDMMTATHNYADSDELPKDPERFFKLDKGGQPFWREWMEPATPDNPGTGKLDESWRPQ